MIVIYAAAQILAVPLLGWLSDRYVLAAALLLRVNPIPAVPATFAE